jgi:hypothetical protein
MRSCKLDSIGLKRDASSALPAIERAGDALRERGNGKALELLLSLQALRIEILVRRPLAGGYSPARAFCTTRAAMSAERPARNARDWMLLPAESTA